MKQEKVVDTIDRVSSEAISDFDKIPIEISPLCRSPHKVYRSMPTTVNLHHQIAAVYVDRGAGDVVRIGNEK